MMTLTSWGTSLPVGTRSSGMSQSPVAEIVDRLAQLGLGVHHERAVMRDRFLERLAGDQQRAARRGAGRDLHRAFARQQRELLGFERLALVANQHGAIHA